MDERRVGAGFRARLLRSATALHRRGHGQSDRVGGACALRSPLYGGPGSLVESGQPHAGSHRRWAWGGSCAGGASGFLRGVVVRRRGAAFELAVGRLPLRSPCFRHGRRPDALLRRLRRLYRPDASRGAHRRLHARGRSCSASPSAPVRSGDGDLCGSRCSRTARPACRQRCGGRDAESGCRPGQCRQGLRGRLQPRIRSHRQPRPGHRPARRRRWKRKP